MQATEGVVIENLNFAAEHMRDVGVIPGRLRGQDGSPHFHAVDGVVQQSVAANQRSHVVIELGESIDQPGLTTRIRIDHRLHRIGIDVNDRPKVILDDIVHDDGLSTPHEDGRRCVATTPTSITCCLTVGVVAKHTVRNSHVGLMHFDSVESVETTFDRRQTAAEGDQGVVNAAFRLVCEEQTAPLTGQRQRRSCHRSWYRTIPSHRKNRR